MSITFNAVGSTLVASVVDGNFALLEAKLREQVLNSEINTATINRLLVKRFECGRLVSANIRSLDILDQGQGYDQNNQGQYDLNYRKVVSSQDPFLQMSQLMEFLGKPGPSMYWQFEEDAITYASGLDPNRYPNNVCYSNWLTVPNSTFKVYVPYPCIAKVEGSAYFLGSSTAIGWYVDGNGPTGGATSETEWDTNYRTHGKQIAMRIALVVDTNPVLHSDEFTNTNTNLLDSAGATASHVSWKFIKQKKIQNALWSRPSIDGSVVLKGGRWYNFSMKFQGAGTMGYITGGTHTDGIYEIKVAGLPNYVGGNAQIMPHIPPFEILWISNALTVEFIYGYGSIVSDTSTITTAP